MFLIHTAVLGTGLALLITVHPRLDAAARQSALKRSAVLVRKLAITDLCLFTEVRYTRHLSQADLFSAFQESPLAFEHYPSGSMTRPPAWRTPAAGAGEGR